MSAPWWIWRAVQTRLSKWTIALLQGKRYKVDLSPHGTGYHNADSKVIHANPEMFPDEPPERKFRITQGILAHEVAHALFTSSWPTKKENVLRQVVNILEDQRIERAISVLYPGVEPVIRELGDLCYADISHLDEVDLPPIAEERPAQRVIHACLAWRWAHNRTSTRDMLQRVGLSKRTEEAKVGRQLWKQVRPLVEASWNVRHTDEVIKLARKILEILGLPEGYPTIQLPALWWDLPISRSEDPAPFPEGPSDDGPGAGLPPKEISPVAGAGKARMVAPEPYIDIEDAALPLAKRLAESLKQPTPDVRPRPVELGGRYSFRQEIRTPDTPFLRRADKDPSARSIAMCLLVDRSGSMDIVEEYVRLATMMLYLACQELEVPIAAAYFGNDWHDNEDPVDEVIAFGDNGDWPKAMIAGYEGHTGAEYLDFGLRWAEDALAARPEGLRMIFVVHDGQPVASWHEGDRSVTDWDVSLNHIQSLERRGIPVIGIYLGNHDGCANRMKELFLRLVVCQAEELPDKLGNLLMSLA